MQREIEAILPPVGAPVTHRAADLRYLGQEHTVTVTVGDLADWPALRGRFDEAHRRAYGYAAPDVPVQLLNLRLAVVFPLEHPRLAHAATRGGRRPRRFETRKIYSMLAQEARGVPRVAARRSSARATAIDGPAAVEEAGTTTIIDAGDALTVEPHGCLVIEVARAAYAAEKGDAMVLSPGSSNSSTATATCSSPACSRRRRSGPCTTRCPRLYAQPRPENVREKGSDAVRTNFAAHMYSDPFARLARHPRMVEPVMQIFGEPVYMHQFKINGKMAFDGDVWQWHQDYGTWKNDDLMPEARAMNVAIFLDEVNEFNGPLMFIPGSHKLGVIEAGARRDDDQLSAVDDRPRHDPEARRARRRSSRPRARQDR